MVCCRTKLAFLKHSVLAYVCFVLFHSLSSLALIDIPVFLKLKELCIEEKEKKTEVYIARLAKYG